MKAAVVEEWGRTPIYTDHPEPVARDGGVVATVEASALTNLTKGLVSGKHYASKELTLPVIPGADGIARLDDGTRVYTGALKPYGMMAERTLVDPHGAVVIPDDVDSVTAAAIPNPGVSAWMSLEHAAAIRPGDHVLVLGATGVTGSTAVQLAKSATPPDWTGCAPSGPTMRSPSATRICAPGWRACTPSAPSTRYSTTCGVSRPSRCSTPSAPVSWRPATTTPVTPRSGRWPA
jgi:hypothetical protein